MSAAKINSIFTHLRKLAQHPLLVRSSYTDAKVAELARLAHQKCAPDITQAQLTRALIACLQLCGSCLYARGGLRCLPTKAAQRVIACSAVHSIG